MRRRSEPPMHPDVYVLLLTQKGGGRVPPQRVVRRSCEPDAVRRCLWFVGVGEEMTPLAEDHTARVEVRPLRALNAPLQTPCGPVNFDLWPLT